MPKPEAIKYLIWHITASPWGTAESIRTFHVTPPPAGRGWADVGYHYIVTNCFPTFDSFCLKRPEIEYDGKVWDGRDLDHDGDIDEEIGAHAYGWNSKSLGIALVGLNGVFTGLQIRAGIQLTRTLMHRYSVQVANVIGHQETGALKTCPDLDMDYIRKEIDR